MAGTACSNRCDITSLADTHLHVLLSGLNDLCFLPPTAGAPIKLSLGSAAIDPSCTEVHGLNIPLEGHQWAVFLMDRQGTHEAHQLIQHAHVLLEIEI